ncbi:MAG: nuclear transport factor 2 family protein [Bacteroidetes bacterium]|nr:nuclear transport factor 2 family protein [Bacteroidota bacterium]
MRKLFFCALLLVVSLVKAQTAEQSKVNQSLTKVFDALAALDLKGITDYTTKDFTVLESGVVWNLDTLSRKIDNLKGTSYARTNHLDFVKTEIQGNTAWAVYHNSADIVINGEEIHARWLESAVLIKESGIWKIKLLHSTVLKRKQ